MGRDIFSAHVVFFSENIDATILLLDNYGCDYQSYFNATNKNDNRIQRRREGIFSITA